MKTNILIALILSNLIFAQHNPDFVINPGFEPQHIEFSSNDKYLILENTTNYQVWNLQNKTLALKGAYKYIVGQSIPGISVSEGSGYMLFEAEDVFLVVNYTLNLTNVEAFSLKDGKMLWQLENLDMAISEYESVYMILKTARTLQKSEFRNFDIQRENNLLIRDNYISRLINYMPERNAIAINGKEGLQLIDVRDGKLLWNQPDLKGGIGELFYDPKNDIIVAIRIATDEIAHIISRPEIQGLNCETGDLLWTAKYDGTFKDGYAFVLDQTLIVPYYGLAFIDMKTGKEREGDIKKRMESVRKGQRVLSMIMVEGGEQGGNNSKPLFDEAGNLYYFVGVQKNGNINPVGAQKGFLKIDVLNDKVLALETNIARGNNQVVQELLANDIFYVKLTKGSSESFIIAMNSNSGKVIFETKPLKNRLGTSHDPFLLDGDRIVDLSAKGVHIFNSMTGQEIHYVDFKDIGVGRLRNNFIFDEGILIFGVNGVAIIDYLGKVKKKFPEIGKINDYKKVGDEVSLVEDKRFIRIHLKNMEIIESAEFKRKENVFLSPTGERVVRINQDGDLLSVYDLK